MSPILVLSILVPFSPRSLPSPLFFHISFIYRMQSSCLPSQHSGVCRPFLQVFGIKYNLVLLRIAVELYCVSFHCSSPLLLSLTLPFLSDLHFSPLLASYCLSPPHFPSCLSPPHFPSCLSPSSLKYQHRSLLTSVVVYPSLKAYSLSWHGKEGTRPFIFFNNTTKHVI